MNRPIKFRVWNGKEMMYDVCVMFCPGELREFRIYTSSDGEFLGNDKQFEIMEWTGLVDKNGKEIFCGDIVSWGASESQRGEVYYQVGRFWVRNYYVTWQDETTDAFGEGIAHLEVIGDIISNPELIK